ncbi:molybdate transport system regulatory protein [Desulfocicer vacuolatum DSM 3385]|uniref:Molybdate transport system regulatory protein n=1 Tax=Desulfocicer vacuolatum DSM 3385 TaxID=1121400 RepID=A0A1W2AFU9_9BACT|nr:TOBE domain-containing protein [Desulfocicer vacuolatum]SMC59589.1 molybdate transport system regulatory protein [Desulfocicer vacuolatum DSM 3385]
MNSKLIPGAPLLNQQISLEKGIKQGGIVSISKDGQCLDSIQLNQLEQSFRQWTQKSPRADVRLARRRILVIFLLIRYTGAKLNEVLALNPFKDIDFKEHSVHFNNENPDTRNLPRKVQISTLLSSEIQEALGDRLFKSALENRFDVDPGFVRRKFYERAQACGFSKGLGGPEMVRKARAIELLQRNMPLPAVQKVLGHSTPNLTGSYVSFSAEEIQRLTRIFIEREASHKSSARNSFFGKIQALQRGDIQTRVTLTTISGYCLITVITNDSLEQLALDEGRLVTAEVKAPWIILHNSKEAPRCSAENKFNGVIEDINKGKINTEYTVRITDGTLLCAVVSTKGAQTLGLNPGDPVWALFSCFAVILNVD